MFSKNSKSKLSVSKQIIDDIIIGWRIQVQYDIIEDNYSIFNALYGDTVRDVYITDSTRQAFGDAGDTGEMLYDEYGEMSDYQMPDTVFGDLFVFKNGRELINTPAFIRDIPDDNINPITLNYWINGIYGELFSEPYDFVSDLRNLFQYLVLTEDKSTQTVGSKIIEKRRNSF